MVFFNKFYFVVVLLSTFKLIQSNDYCSSIQLPAHCGCDQKDAELPSIMCHDITPDDFIAVLNAVKGSNLKSLEFSHCDPFITHLEPLPPMAVKNIVFDECGIETIADNAFVNVSQLENLSLFTNKIKVLPLFGTLPSLKYLTLARNKIGRLDHKDFGATSGNAQNTFDGLSNLKELYLSHNAITEITDTAFKSLTNLTDITLDHNPLQKLSPLAFASQRLRVLILGHALSNGVLSNVPPYVLPFLNKYYINGTYYEINDDGTPIPS